jgi:glycerophosphoryl diester phosphodiesterase
LPRSAHRHQAEERLTSKLRIFGHGPVDGTGPALNTLESFGMCRLRGADGVELDVRRTADDHVVVVHDALLGEGRSVARATRRELPASIPDLVQALDECAGLTVNVELKNFPSDHDFDPSQRITHLLIDLLEGRAGMDQVIVSCFDLAAIDLVKRRAPSLPTAALLLSRRNPDSLLGPVVDYGHLTVHPYDTMVDGSFMEATRSAGLRIHPWLGEVGAERMRALLTLGADGLITSEVSAARSVVDGMRQA